MGFLKWDFENLLESGFQAEFFTISLEISLWLTKMIYIIFKVRLLLESTVSVHYSWAPHFQYIAENVVSCKNYESNLSCVPVTYIILGDGERIWWSPYPLLAQQHKDGIFIIFIHYNFPQGGPYWGDGEGKIPPKFLSLFSGSSGSS